MPIKKMIAIVILLTLASCFGKGKESKETPTVGAVKIVAVFTKPDSTKQLDILIREIAKTIKYDSVAKKDVILTDTLWAFPRVDSVGKPPNYYIISKDSVNWRIEGKPLESLLKKN